ncbi:MAG: hypothetical protein U5Q03_09995 [Bacteroidota bacterium]|nr:hypothetical protein [Bacteroidota bacterium]
MIPNCLNIVGEGDTLETGQTEPGIYVYYVTQTIGCESDPTEITLTINAAPDVSLEAFEPVCESEAPFELTGGLPEGGIYFGDGIVNNIFDPAEAGIGIHVVRYLYIDENFCSDTAFSEILVNASPDVSFAPLTAVCFNDETFELSGGMPVGGTYYGDGVTDNMFNPSGAGIGSHLITYSYTDEQGCTNTAEQSIMVYANPVVDLGMDTIICNYQEVVLDASIPNAASYHWTPGDFATASIAVDSVMIGIGSTEFSVVATDENGCSGTDSIVVTIEDCTGLEEISGLRKLDIFPNPNDGSFTLRMQSQEALKLNLRLINANGKSLIKENNININGRLSAKV